MNLEEAVNKLNEIVLKCLQYTAELGYETDIYNGDTPIPYKEIERVLQELDNSISKDKVKEKINRIETRISYVKTEISKTLRENEEEGTETEIDINEQYIEHLEIELEELEITKRILEELLEDK